MPHLVNIAYVFVLLLLSPWLLYKALTTGKFRRGIWTKLMGSAVVRQGSERCVWFHGVSVGEIHLLGTIVAGFRRRHPDWQCVISTTTNTGYEEARKRFADLPVFFWPLDFTWAVRRALRRVRPSLVVLAECELWPNFLMLSKRMDIPVAVINGRMSPRSQHRFQKARWLVRRLFARLDLCAVQSTEHAVAFRSLGATNVVVTGSVKYDGAGGDRNNPRTRELARLFAIADSDLVWVAGSTQAPEEQVVLDIFRRTRQAHPSIRLLLVPRHKERFDEVAHIVSRSGLPLVRRSRLESPVNRDDVILVDTMGELGAVWGLAHIAFVGGSLDGRRGGQNMIEPAAYGAAVLFGPHTWNFKDAVARLMEQGGAIQVMDAANLERQIMRLLADPDARKQLGAHGRRFVLAQQGATDKTLQALECLIVPGQIHCEWHTNEAAA